MEDKNKPDQDDARAGTADTAPQTKSGEGDSTRETQHEDRLQGVGVDTADARLPQDIADPEVGAVDTSPAARDESSDTTTTGEVREVAAAQNPASQAECMASRQSAQEQAHETAQDQTKAEEQAKSNPALPMWLRVFGHRLIAPLFLILFSLAMFCAGQMAVPPLDRDEPRFTQASKQMLESGDYVQIRFQDEGRNKKPVGVYWLQVAAAKLTGYGEAAPLWVYRLPSLLGAIAAVLGTYWAARAFMGPAAALTGAMLLATTIILSVEARLGKTDAALLAFIVLAQGALARLWLRWRSARDAGTLDTLKIHWPLMLVFWVSLGISTLIKGPVGLMVSGLTVAGLVVYERRLALVRMLAPLSGLAVLLALVLPWLIAIYLATDGAFFQEAIGRDLLGKVSQGQEGHGAPPLTHFAISFVIFWPLSAFAVLSAPALWRARKAQVLVFALCWLVPSWLVFELVTTKLPHYTMPMLPALAMAVGAVLLLEPAGAQRLWLRRTAAGLLGLVAVLVAIAALAGPAWLGVWPSPAGAALCIFGAVLAVWSARQMLRQEVLASVFGAGVSAAVVMTGFWGFVGPSLSPIWLSPRLVAAIDSGSHCAEPQVITAGFNEPSFVFLQGTKTILADGTRAAEFLSEGNSCRVAIVDQRHKAAFDAAVQALGLHVTKIGHVDGLNINGGKEMSIDVLQRAAETAPVRTN
ncbi:ArnT family glycosyltransferase [Polycladidibacter hongkongensis]|uniref:ArnT family glycosyltransferase n=1 Tax=Polycladidibacter hongkongensis TaxID=1647556 RepID=UPI000ABD01A6|nr:glycosyltransferase family 39 protein [Pseudovibrio hongkongensis]